MRFTVLDNNENFQDFTLGLPGGVISMDDLSISDEGFLFGLSVASPPALCSFQIDVSTLVPINCLSADWSQAPYTGMSASGGVVVISGGEGGMTLVRYDTTSGVLDSVLDCLNCTTIQSDIGQKAKQKAFWPNVEVLYPKGDGALIAALSTVWSDAVAGVTLVDLSSLQEIGRIELDFVLTDSTPALGSPVTNYPLVTEVYDSPMTGIRTLFVAHGEVVAQQLEGGGDKSTLQKPFNEFLATCLSVDPINAVLAVGGYMNETSSALAVYDIVESAGPPQLRVAFTMMGQVLSIAVNADRIAYVTGESPNILVWDASLSRSSSSSSSGSSTTPTTMAPAPLPPAVGDMGPPSIGLFSTVAPTDSSTPPADSRSSPPRTPTLWPSSKASVLNADCLMNLLICFHFLLPLVGLKWIG